MNRWPTMRLGDTVLPTQQRDPRQKPSEEFCYVDIAGVDNEAKTIVVTKRIVGADAPSRARKVISRGDVIVSTVRPNLNAVALVTDNLDNQICSTGFSVLSPSSKVTSGYLFAFVRSPSFIDYLVARTMGANYPAVNDGEVKDVPIPVPPLAEQERIVKLLDEADELRKLRAQADRRTDDLIPSLFHEMFGENAKKPHDRVKLEQIAEVVSGVAKGRKFNGRLPVEVPYLRVANVQAGHLDLSEIKTIKALPEEVKELGLRKGDVLLTEGGDFDKLGRGAMLEQDLPNCIHQNHVFRVRVEQSKLNPVYFAKFLLTGEARGYFLGCAKRTTNLASINMTQLRGLPVLLPPLPLQKEFAARVSEIRAMQAEQTASRRRLDELFQSMLHRAFSGEL
jgi:type I restriction enzyme, S subunit